MMAQTSLYQSSDRLFVTNDHTELKQNTKHANEKTESDKMIHYM